MAILIGRTVLAYAELRLDTQILVPDSIGSTSRFRLEDFQAAKNGTTNHRTVNFSLSYQVWQRMIFLVTGIQQIFYYEIVFHIQLVYTRSLGHAKISPF